jgi:hypothetical protein
MVIIECSIIGSTGNRVHVVDISNFSAIEYIYSEEFGYTDPEPQVSWSINNEFVCLYKFVYEEFQGTVVYKPEIMQKDELYGYEIVKECLGIKDIVTSVTIYRRMKNTLSNSGSISVSDISSGNMTTNTATRLLTLSHDIFGNNTQKMLKDTYDRSFMKTEFGTLLCGANKMIEVTRQESENFKDYFRFYMKK